MFPDLSNAGRSFHEMFNYQWDESRCCTSGLFVNPSKKHKKCTDDYGPSSKSWDFEILGNASVFEVYEVSRLIVFEKSLRKSSYIHGHLKSPCDIHEGDYNYADEIVDPKLLNVTSNVSKVVKIGVRSIFELIEGSRIQFPDLCVKAVRSLLTLFEGLEPEALSDEPNDIIGDMFNVLLNIVNECLNEKTDKTPNLNRLVEISSACLLSFAIIRGDTGKMLRAVYSMLISEFSAHHNMLLPNAVIELQKNVQSILIDKLKRPDWFSHGILKTSCVLTFEVLFPSDETIKTRLKVKNVTCDGNFLYVNTTHGMYKIGTGYNGTISKNIYAFSSAFFCDESSWIGFLRNTLYFILSKPKGSNEIYTVNTNTLELQTMLRIDATLIDLNSGKLFLDEDSLGIFSSITENVLTIKYLDLNDTKATLSSNELHLQLSKTYFRLYGTICGNDDIIMFGDNLGIPDELAAFVSGREFSLLQTTGGKVFYNNKLGNQNFRIPATRNLHNWIELTNPTMSTVKQCVIGNEGSVGLLIYTDGSVYFIGLAKRGEDGENGVARRQCYQVKPRKMTRMEGKFVTYAACNHGTTALVTDRGELYMFGKDAIHCEVETGLVSDLKNVRVCKVALGKVHVLVLSDRGVVYTLGYNGRGQCGRYTDCGGFQTLVDTNVMDDEVSGSSDDAYSDIICSKGTHVFKQDACMICPICHQCTGYGSACLATNQEGREPGQECGCGEGDSGCAKCCICKVCAFEDDPDRKIAANNKVDELIEINLFGVKHEQGAEKIHAEVFKKNDDVIAGSSDDMKIGEDDKFTNINVAGNDSTNMGYLYPARVHFRTTVSVVQIAAGLYHSVVLMENGEVYTFGSNSCGQLGVSDTNQVGPIRVSLPSIIVQIAAGSNHSAALTATGEVYTFGNNTEYQLQFGDHAKSVMSIEELSRSSVPKLIPNIGIQFCEKAVEIGASGDLTYLKIYETYINSSTIESSIFVADKNHFLLLPVKPATGPSKHFECVTLEKRSRNFKTFNGPDQVNFTNCVACYDPIYNVLWSVEDCIEDNLDIHAIVNCYNAIAGEVKDEFSSPNILDCELAVPVIPLLKLPCYQTAIHVLACLDMVARTKLKSNIYKTTYFEQKHPANVKSLRKDDYSVVNRFQALGNSWTYNIHNAVEAIRFSSDADVLIGGIGLYGGRGGYHARIKLYEAENYEIIQDSKDNKPIISTDEIVYECSSKQIYCFMFEEPVVIRADRWYIIWVQIKGSPSDCGNSGQSYVVTDDEVLFQFRSCLLSNNGTNISAGQIPQLLYKILQPEIDVPLTLRNTSFPLAHILSTKLDSSICDDVFRCLIDLLGWCWEEFKTKYSKISNLMFSPVLLESVRQFDKLVYINQACQHLIRAFIYEIYPEDCRIRERKSQIYCTIPHLIGEVRKMLHCILSDTFIFDKFGTHQRVNDGSTNIFYKLVKQVLKDCSDTFIYCFYAFYPTPTEKWIFLCYLLDFKKQNEFINDHLIIATLCSLYSPNCLLKCVFPILFGGFNPDLLSQQHETIRPPYFHNYFPILSETLFSKTQSEISAMPCSWTYIVGRILEMASQPLKDKLRGIRNEHDSQISLHSCHVLSKLVRELAAEAMGVNDDVQRRKEQMLLTTPIRFRRINANKTWNTGNGSPDAICFTVNKKGIVVVGVGVFGGNGNYEYELELLEGLSNKGKNDLHYNQTNLPHWKCVTLLRGSFNSTDYKGKEIVELNFEYPVVIRENVKYVIKLRLRGNRTNNGELGQAVVTCPHDIVFTFINTDVSYNGTSISRGQLPYIIYYKYPQRSDQELRQKLSVESQAQEAIVSISSQVFNELKTILTESNNMVNISETIDILNEAPFVRVLIPLLITHLSPVVALHPQNALQVLSTVEKVLPLVCAINRHIILKSACNTHENASLDKLTTGPYYSLVESDHPYKRPTVSKYIVKFPENVLWLSLEFDPRCGTTQEEDVLKIYVCDFFEGQESSSKRKLYKPLPKTYGNIKNSWPSSSIIIPGNEVIFSLETASKYSSLVRGTSFGFRCLVIGFEMISIDSVPRLELELNVLACRCASYLIEKKSLFSTNLINEREPSKENLNIEAAELDYERHYDILNRGMNLYREKVLKQTGGSSKMSASVNGIHMLDSSRTNFLSAELKCRNFLSDFINYKVDTAGGRLARWLQPDSFVDIDKCEVIFPMEKLRCGCITSIDIVIRDQYGDIILVPDLTVKVACICLTKLSTTANRKTAKYDSEAGGESPRKVVDFTVPYKPVTKNAVRYNAISFMKEYSDHCFEEIRYLTPDVSDEKEHLSVSAKRNGVFTADWSPKDAGFYSMSVEIDGYISTETAAKRMEVKIPTFGLTPPIYKSAFTELECSSGPSRQVKRKMNVYSKHSAGLRIRAQPSLQAEQIGIIPPNSTLTFTTDEIENGDGVWVKLTHDCTTHYCKQPLLDAWSLKFNKHYESQLLFIAFSDNEKHVDKPFVRSAAEKSNAFNENNFSDTRVYRVIKCGVSGHNIRAYPSLKAPSVGMIFADQEITSEKQVYNKEGIWVKLEKETLKKLGFLLLQYESVWTLAVDKSQIVYLKPDLMNWREHTSEKQLYVKSSHEKLSSSKFRSNEKLEENVVNRIYNKNGERVINLNVPPTPKKRRKCFNVVDTDVTESFSSDLNCTSNQGDDDALSNCSASIDYSHRSTFPQLRSSFIEKFEKDSHEYSTFVTSGISESSGTASSGYQASIETSSNSAALFASRNSEYFRQESNDYCIVTQAATQTSPRIFSSGRSWPPKEPLEQANVCFNNGSIRAEFEHDPSPEDVVRNVRTVNGEDECAGSRLLPSLSDHCIVEIMDWDDDASEFEESKRYNRVSEGINKTADDDAELISYEDLTVSVENGNGKYMIGGNCENRIDFRSSIVSHNDKSDDSINESEISYKTGLRPSVAESVRSVFAAFLWHEGLVQDAMTCATFLKLHPHLCKDEKLDVKRDCRSKMKSGTQRYSVEVGLSGNCHHPIKASTMQILLPSKKCPTEVGKTKRGTLDDCSLFDSIASSSPRRPVALKYVVILWNEVAKSCFQSFLKSITYWQNPTVTTGNETSRGQLIKWSSAISEDDKKKYTPKLVSDIYRKFASENVCELCGTKYSFPVTYHMRQTHKGCGKTSVFNGYSVNGKYTSDLSGNCGEGGGKNFPAYILCDGCREKYLSLKKKGNVCTPFAAFSHVSDEVTSAATWPIQETHLAMKENAMFALELSGNDQHNLMPIVFRSFPRLRTLGCLPSFGIDSYVIPSEVNLYSSPFEEQFRNREDYDSEKEEIANTMNGFQRLVSLIGHSNCEVDDNLGEKNSAHLLSSLKKKRYSADYDLEHACSSATSESLAKLEMLANEMKSTNHNGNGGGLAKLDRPIIAFVSDHHNLTNLRKVIEISIEKAVYRNYGLRAMNWLLRTVTIPTTLHDIMWWFVRSFSIPLQVDDVCNESCDEWNDEFDLTRICEHPLVDVALAGVAKQYISSSFHMLLQTIADLMLIFPVGSPLQQMAIKCWGFQFTQNDYNFLHRSKLFVNISKILSRSESEEEQDYNNSVVYESHSSGVSKNDQFVQVLRDITSCVSIAVSSQSNLVHNLTDNSTETYWQSGDEDKKKMKTIMINCPLEVDPQIVYIHADNTRDTNNKLLGVMILTGTYADSLKKVKSLSVDSDYCGWITCFVPGPNQQVIRIDCKGDNTVRIRQIKVSGEVVGNFPQILKMPCSLNLQQRQCESETLKVFRLIIFQVFGELLENLQPENVRLNGEVVEHGSSDLKEHMVGILFSRRKLNNLQKQVCTHIVQTIKRETCIIREEWEKYVASGKILKSRQNEFQQYDVNDAYCFEMLCMVSALSGSEVGRSYLARQHDFIHDLLELLHIGTTRLQRQVVLLLRRVLPGISPETFSEIIKIRFTRVVDFRVTVSSADTPLDVNKKGILDILLSTIAKNLILQVKIKSDSNEKGSATKTNVFMSDCLTADNIGKDRWYFMGNVNKELSTEVYALLKDMNSGKTSHKWQEVTKTSIAENILNMANLSKIIKDRTNCLTYPTFWVGLASLSIIDTEHVQELSSANWKNEDNGDNKSMRPLCENHDDGKCVAVIQCNICGLLCLECDRFLHLSRKTCNHERKVCKEEEDAIKVDLHEGCGRVKLFWLLALVDSNTFKGVVEFRENSHVANGSLNNRKGAINDSCRFCGRRSDQLSEYSTCYDEECLQYVPSVCNKIHSCGHLCGGIQGEEKCLPCLHGCAVDCNISLKQDADDMCMICFTEALSAAPSIQLECGHVYHYHCCKNVLLKKWPGPRITFNFQQCPICKRSVRHAAVKDFLIPVWELMEEVRKKALMRLEYEGCPRNIDDPAVYAMEKYAYYVCFKCKKAYFGGEARCEAEVDNSDFNPKELICGGCSDVSGARVCVKHGTDFLEYKCRYCCSVAVYFCFGSTHFCNVCHENFQKVVYMSPADLPPCPAGPKGISLNQVDCPLHIKHPPTGEEFALGCGVCRTGKNF